MYKLKEINLHVLACFHPVVAKSKNTLCFARLLITCRYHLEVWKFKSRVEESLDTFQKKNVGGVAVFDFSPKSGIHPNHSLRLRVN